MSNIVPNCETGFLSEFRDLLCLHLELSAALNPAAGNITWIIQVMFSVIYESGALRSILFILSNVERKYGVV